MSCLKGKSESRPKTGRYRCQKCEAVSKKQGHLCKPEVIADQATTKGKRRAKGKGS